MRVDAENQTTALTPAELRERTNEFFANGQNDLAVELAETFLETAKAPKFVQRKAILAEVLLKAGRRAEAIACLRSAEKELTAQNRLKLATLLMQDGQTGEAVSALPDEAALRATSQNLIPRCLAYTRVLVADNRIKRAQTALRNLAGDMGNEQAPGPWLEFGRLCLEIGLTDLTQRAAEKVLLSPESDERQWSRAFNQLQLSLADGQSVPDLQRIVTAMDQRLAALGWPRDVCVAYARCLRSCGQPEKADSILEREFNSPETAPFLIQRVLNKVQINDVPAAIEAAQTALASPSLNNPQREKIALVLSKLLTQRGQFHEAAAALNDALSKVDSFELKRHLFILKRKILPVDDIVEIRSELSLTERQKLPASLKEGLSEIPLTPRESVFRTGGPIRELWQYQGLGLEQWPDWSARYDWGRSASKLTRHWGLFADDDKKHELFDLIAPVDSSLVDDAMSLGRGAIIATSHIGPVGAAFFAVEKLGYPLRYLAAGGNFAKSSSEGIDLADTTPTQSVRRVIQHLKLNGLLGLTTDVVSYGNFHLLEIENLRIRVSALPARLSWKLSVPTLWCQSEWIEGKVHVRFRAFPMPEPGEAEADFTDRWRSAHEEFLHTCLQSSPENLGGLPLYSPSNLPDSMISAIVSQPRQRAD